MTVVKCTVCNKTSVTGKKLKDSEKFTCYYCGEHGFFSESTDSRFKGEGFI